MPRCFLPSSAHPLHQPSSPRPSRIAAAALLLALAPASRSAIPESPPPAGPEKPEAGPAAPGEPPRGSPVQNIRANQIQIKQENNKTIVVLQDNIYVLAIRYRIRADYAEGHQNPDGQFIMGFARGNVRIFLEDAMLKGDRLDYDINEEKIYLTAEAGRPDPQAYREGKVVSSRQIVYDLRAKDNLNVEFRGDAHLLEAPMPDEYFTEFPDQPRPPAPSPRGDTGDTPKPDAETGTPEAPVVRPTPVTAAGKARSTPKPDVQPSAGEPSPTRPGIPAVTAHSQSTPKPDAQPARPSTPASRKTIRMPASLGLSEEAFEIPGEERDAHGNPVSHGLDAKSGWPLEIRHRETGMHIVFVPPGEFSMGSPSGERDRDSGEEAPHPVSIASAFYLGKYEVTQAEWKKVLGTQPWLGRDKAIAGPAHAANWISWTQSRRFIEKLNQGLDKDASLRFALPTEALWEYACRAGTATRFYFGDDLPYSTISEHAWYARNADAAGEKYPHTVGRKKPNPWGLYDMAGNLWEWCDDPWIEKATATDPEGSQPVVQDTVAGHVLRGGSWSCPPNRCRSAFRYWGISDLDWNSHGLRVVLRAPMK
ncbi:MAG: SUMF1/EgtB/PvdO family nonheme iron enzyme [Planctomycetes bacterium]|nr:SUMF1/EgtB/PvdO family nonheme iron enzyme [Planctomycetota bacterium]